MCACRYPNMTNPDFSHFEIASSVKPISPQLLMRTFLHTYCASASPSTGMRARRSRVPGSGTPLLRPLPRWNLGGSSVPQRCPSCQHPAGWHTWSPQPHTLLVVISRIKGGGGVRSDNDRFPVPLLVPIAARLPYRLHLAITFFLLLCMLLDFNLHRYGSVVAIIRPRPAPALSASSLLWQAWSRCVRYGWGSGTSTNGAGDKRTASLYPWRALSASHVAIYLLRHIQTQNSTKMAITLSDNGSSQPPCPGAFIDASCWLSSGPFRSAIGLTCAVV